MILYQLPFCTNNKNNKQLMRFSRSLFRTVHSKIPKCAMAPFSSSLPNYLYNPTLVDVPIACSWPNLLLTSSILSPISYFLPWYLRFRPITNWTMGTLQLPSADPTEHQHWTEPILCEETRARLEYYRSLGWLPPNYKPKTLQGIAVVERYWRRYCAVRIRFTSANPYIIYTYLEFPLGLYAT